MPHTPLRFSLSARFGLVLLAGLLTTGWAALAAGSASPVAPPPAGTPAYTRLAQADAPTPLPLPPSSFRLHPSYQCRWTDRPIRIDGKGDDEAWKAAAVIDHFLIPGVTKKGRRPKTATRARLLWDRENLYFLAEMEDHDLFADVTEHDGKTWLNDAFEVFLKPRDDRPGYYEFEVNAANTVMDMFLPSRDSGGYAKYIHDGDFHLETKVQLRGTLNKRDDRDDGYTVEGRIPWTDLLRTGGRPEIGEAWKFALCRYDYTLGQEPERSTSAPLTQPDFHRYEEYSTLEFTGPTSKSAQPFGIDRRVPFTTSQVIGSPDPPLPFRVRRVYPRLKLTYPVMTVHEPNSNLQLAIVQQYPGGPSRIIRFRDDPEVDSFETLLTLDRCAYDLCFHPRFAENGYFYVGSKGELSVPSEARTMRITRYTLARPQGAIDGKLAAGSEQTILEWPSDGHDGGAMVFGKDGMFYVTTGDGTSDSDKNIVGQDLSRLTAKVLRIDLEHPDPGRTYSVPADNPFVGKDGIRPETWSYGMRNPWRMAVDSHSGRIWVGQNGQDLWEQVYLLQRGANYGWSVYEGSHPFYLNRKLGPTPLVPPTFEHPHSEMRSLTGGLVYYGSRFPELQGAYLYGDYSTGVIWAGLHDGTRVVWHRQLARSTLQITGLGTDSHGEILITDIRGSNEGGFYTLGSTPKDLPPSHFPTLLSQSGLFRSVKGHVVQPGLIPYEVNAPLWSDGAYKERYIALPGADSRIDFTTYRGWNFPDHTVLVKSFALEREEGKPATRRWVETRFLVKEDGQWTGYSYLWNEEQTDATLVTGTGQDHEFSIRVAKSPEYPDGVRKQVWHYPSRSECMVCHSRAANFVLGLSVAQLNREHDYGRVRDNQLRVLEHLGVLRVDWASEAQDRVRSEARARGWSDAQVEAYVAKQTASDGQRQASPSTHLAAEPEQYPHLVDPYDPKQELPQRVKSYFQGNCAQCHVEAGGGNSQIDLEYSTALEEMRLLGVKPLHDAFNLPEPLLVAPGSPERSVLLHRISNRDKGHMPPLATSRVDTEAVKLMDKWIRSLKTER